MTITRSVLNLREWQQGHVGWSTAEASNQQQQLMEENEMATWLHHYLEGGGGDLYSEMMGPSSRARSCSQVHQEEGAAAVAAAARQGSSRGVVTVDAGNVFDAGSVRASVAECSTHVSDRKRKGGPTRAGKDGEMMSPVQYNMGQMMFPYAQRYLLTMGFMGMSMGMPSGCMQRPVMPFGSILPYPPVAGLSPANLWPQLVPSFYPATAAIPDPVRIEASTQQDPVSNSIRMVGPNMVQIPNFADPHHHYAPLHHLQVPSQGQILGETGTSKGTAKRSTG